MMKVIAVVDKELTALDRLAQGMKPYHGNLDFHIVAVHPKRPDAFQLAQFERLAYDADIIDWQYYRTADMLRQRYDWLKDKKHILTHHNPYAIEESDWNTYDLVIGNNQHIYKRLGDITTQPVEYVPNCVDTEFWTYRQDWEPTKNVIMVANRIEGKKGILPVAQACAELNLHFILVGSISDSEYFYKVMQTGNVEFHQQIPDEKLRQLYYKSTIHVCNSVDNFESGTLPILEAMLCGVPVMTRMIGHVPELNNGENMVIFEGDNEDVPALRDKLAEMIFDKKKLQDIREKAWQTAKARSFERRAYMYQKLYRQVLYPDQKPVTVVVPIYEKHEIIRKCLDAIEQQTYKNIEIIVADDGPPHFGNIEVIRDFARYTNKPLRYMSTASVIADYGLARARNYATIEATGEIMVYCDQRMVMHSDAIEQFVKYSKPRFWLFGNKGGKKQFVENFSAVLRRDVIDAGMFCERINQYGGMSEELRKRINHQRIQTEYIESAKAIPTGKSSNRNRRRQEIIRMKNKTWKMYDA